MPALYRVSLIMPEKELQIEEIELGKETERELNFKDKTGRHPLYITKINKDKIGECYEQFGYTFYCYEEGIIDALKHFQKIIHGTLKELRKSYNENLEVYRNIKRVISDRLGN